MLTKEQYNILKKYEQHLKTAKSNYIHGVYTKDAEEMLEIYKTYGKTTNIHCANCLLEMIKFLAIEYDKKTNDINGKQNSTRAPKSTKTERKAKNTNSGDNSRKES